MNIVFWVTERCNLNCDYCYVKKQPKTMTLETAEKAFLYFKELFSDRDFQDGELHIGFHGGEPLINFPVIKYLTEKLKREYEQKIKYFSLTTNGTIFDKEMFNYLKDSVQLSVSIDGNRETNDLKRHYIDGRSSYDETINTLEYLKRNDIFTRVRMTVNKDSVKNFADNYIFLDKRGYGIVTYAINMDENWSKEDMEQYENQLSRIMDYFLSEKPEEGKYFLYNLKESTFRCRSYCDGGVTNFHISADGDLFPCIMALDDSEFRLGNVFDGIDTYALNRLQKINQQSVNGCENCIFQSHCASQVCKIINKKVTGDYYKAPTVSCDERHVLYRLYKKYGFVLEGFDA